MSTQVQSQKKAKKPAACDTCKARRVACHPQPNGPCPRCAESNTVCKTTPVQRGRPRRAIVPGSSSMPLAPLAPQASLSLPPATGSLATFPDCPELTPELVSHCFEGLKFTPPQNHPLISATSIRADVQAASFQLNLLPPQSRVLALCIVAFVSLASFHPSILGDGPRPSSFLDDEFFSSDPDFLQFGVRRAPAYRALRGAAIKAAWENCIILQPSNENAASCYLLDLLDQSDFQAASRPWANAYVGHLRALAPVWRASGYTASGHWSGFLHENPNAAVRLHVFVSGSNEQVRRTLHDQLLICGPEPAPLDNLLSSLENFPEASGLSLLWTSVQPYLFHVTNLARQLSETIAGDYARTSPLSEGAVIKFLSSLSLLHSALSLLLERVDAAITSTTDTGSLFVLEDASADVVARASAYAVVFGFTGLVLPFYRELLYREHCPSEVQNPRTRDRLRLLRIQAHEMAVVGARELVRSLRYLPKIHYTPAHWTILSDWAKFCAEEAESGVLLSSEDGRALQTIVGELKLLGYSLDVVSTPHGLALIERLEAHTIAAQLAPPPLPTSTLIDSAVLPDLFDTFSWTEMVLPGDTSDPMPLP
ncbi:hypothetical protein C8R46DRAFT_1057526 [Mycena filopes]|nr:hypothetical protein C8R46DRAFT_1057526 [Mycena filopes]